MAARTGVDPKPAEAAAEVALADVLAGVPRAGSAIGEGSLPSDHKPAWSAAGAAVIEPIMVPRIASIVLTGMEMRNFAPVHNTPTIAIITVVPETGTA